MKASEFAKILSAYSDLLRTHGAARGAELATELTALIDAPSPPGASVEKLLHARLVGISAAGASGTVGDALAALATLAALLTAAGAKAAVLTDLALFERALRPYARADLPALVGAIQSGRAAKPAAVRTGRTTSSGRAKPSSEAPTLAARTRRAPAAAISIPDIVAQLDTAVGDEQKFPLVHEALAALASKDLLAVSKAFTLLTSTTKKDALKRILNRHEDLLDNRRRLRAAGGRSAA